MIRTALLLASPFALVACQATEGALPPPSESAPEPGDAASEIIGSAEALSGEYRVAGIDGAEVDLPHAITASIGAERMEFTSGCIRMAWTYRFENKLLVTAQAPVASCRRALLPQEQALSEAVDQAGVVRQTPANGIELSGGSRSVLLFSQ